MTTLCRRWRTALFIVFTMSSYLAPQQPGSSSLARLYRMARFSQIVQLLEGSSFDELSGEEQILYIECLARTSRGKEAESLLARLESSPASLSQVLAASGSVYLSLGQFDRAEDHIRKSLLRDPDSAKAKLAKMLLMLYLRDYQEARRLYEDFNRAHQDWAETTLLHLIGVEIYAAIGHIAKIGELYKDQAARLKSQDREQYEYFRNNSRLYRKHPLKRSFESANASDKVELPFSGSSGITRCPTLTLNTEDGPFTIILDTGNRSGWMIHSRELDKRLKSKTGGMGLARIGSEEGLLHGEYILTEKLELGPLSLTDLTGMYVPKPHPAYPDANLNPLFIKDRVITLDFIKEALISRSEERFRDDLDQSLSDVGSPIILPWYGYEEAFIPVTINGDRNALAMLETGAGDVTLRLDYAKGRQMPLEPSVMTLASGKQFIFQRTPLSLQLGRFRFDRPAAEVWALGQFTDYLTGFTPDVILGPDFLNNKWAVSFDPFERRIVLSDRSH